MLYRILKGGFLSSFCLVSCSVVVVVVAGAGLVEIFCSKSATGRQAPDRHCLPSEHSVPCTNISLCHLRGFRWRETHLERCSIRRLEIDVAPTPDCSADVDRFTIDTPLAVEPPPGAVHEVALLLPVEPLAGEAVVVVPPLRLD